MFTYNECTWLLLLYVYKQAVIFGPDDTPWEGGTFKLLLEFSEDYPNKPPSVRFITRMYVLALSDDYRRAC